MSFCKHTHKKNPTPTEMLATIGSALYGPRWQSDLARDLRRSDRTMRRWVAGGEIPAVVYGELQKLCSERAAELARLLKMLARVAAAGD